MALIFSGSNVWVFLPGSLHVPSVWLLRILLSTMLSRRSKTCS